MDQAGEIAIIGMAGKYPKADTPAQLWDRIISGQDLSDDGGRIEADGARAGRITKHFALSGIDLFDHEFFGITGFEAMVMDPQHRLMLTCAYRALEDAGYERFAAGERVGVYASASLSTYLIYHVLPSRYFDREDLNYQILLGNDKDALATRISYKLDLSGPAMSIQCACSSSLVALHVASQALLTGDCDVALVGGVSITVPQDRGYHYKEGGILSKDGYCRPVDKAGSGTIKGHGCSVIVLKRLADAVESNDRVRAVIRGTAVNNDGKNKIGFTAPAVSGQRAVIGEAMTFAGTAPDDIDYIETHGTGTELGDPIELTALAQAFAGTKRKIPLGSLKANIGHLDVAAGVTSVVKAVFALNAGVVPPIQNLRTPTDAVTEASSRFEFPTAPVKRPLNNVCVSSFGIGGTNAHVVIGKHQVRPSEALATLPCFLVPVSVNREDDLEPYLEEISAQLASGVELLDLAATLSERRRRRKVALCLVATSSQDLRDQLHCCLAKTRDSALHMPRFSQADLETLYATWPAFAAMVNERPRQQAGRYASALAELLVATGLFDAPAFARIGGPLEDIARAARGGDLSPVAQYLTDPLDAARSEPPPLARLFAFLASLYESCELNLAPLYRGCRWRPVSLPAYPLRPTRHWIDAETQAEVRPAETAAARAHQHDDTLVEEIVAIWRDQIGGDAVAPETTLVDAGADSMTAIEIIDRVNRTYGTAIKLDGSLASVTPTEIAAMILGREVRSSTPWLSYVRYKAGAKRTIFLIHPAGGSTFCYSALNRHLKGDFNIYAIDLPEGYQGYASLGDLARRYAATIQANGTTDPFLIGGYSFGGNLAHEIACELEQQGSAVEAVVMLDSHPPEAYNAYQGGHLDYVGAFPTLVASYFKPERVDEICAESAGVASLEAAIRLVRSKDILNSRLGDDDIVRFYERWTFSHGLLKEHRPSRRSDAELIMLVARDEEPPILLDKLKIQPTSKDAWRKYFHRAARRVDVNGDHFTMFGDNAHLKYLAKAFDAVMHELQGPSISGPVEPRVMAAPGTQAHLNDEILSEIQ